MMKIGCSWTEATTTRFVGVIAIAAMNAAAMAMGILAVAVNNRYGAVLSKDFIAGVHDIL